jgi:hypothetical protein
MKPVFAVVAALVLIGCSQYRMPDLKFTDADHKGGYDRMGTCDTCGAKSPCGPKQDVLVWATEHARQTGHTSFSHHWCNVRGDLPEFGPDRRAAQVAPANGGAAAGTPAAPAKPKPREPAVGMTIDEARTAMGVYGTSDGGREDQGEKIIRFLQTRNDGSGVAATRNVWVTFENGKATNVTYGQWNR